MTVFLISSSGDGYETNGEFAALLIAPDGETLQARLEEFRATYRVALVDPDERPNWPAELARYQGNEALAAQLDQQAPDVFSPTSSEAKHLLAEELRQAFLRDGLVGTDERPETLHVLVRWLIRECHWREFPHQQFRIGREGQKASLGPFVGYTHPENNPRPYGEQSRFLARDVFAEHGWNLSDAEITELSLLGWFRPGYCTPQEADDVIRQVKRNVNLILLRSGYDPQDADMRIRNVNLGTLVQEAGQWRGHSRGAQTPAGRLAGRKTHYDAAWAELEGVHDTRERARLSAVIRPWGCQLVVEGPPSTDFQTPVTTEDLRPFPAVVKALMDDGLWPPPAL